MIRTEVRPKRWNVLPLRKDSATIPAATLSKSQGYSNKPVTTEWCTEVNDLSAGEHEASWKQTVSTVCLRHCQSFTGSSGRSEDMGVFNGPTAACPIPGVTRNCFDAHQLTSTAGTASDQPPLECIEMQELVIDRACRFTFGIAELFRLMPSGFSCLR